MLSFVLSWKIDTDMNLSRVLMFAKEDRMFDQHYLSLTNKIFQYMKTVIFHPLVLVLILCLSPVMVVIADTLVTEKTITAETLMERCASKSPGDDQRSRFTVLLRDTKGKIKKSEYLRIWKDYKGREGVSDKMMLFTIFPPKAKGASFMRVAYVPDVNRNIDQWIYLPVLKKIRRVSIRNPSDSFLNSNLTYADVGTRALEQDRHKYLGVKQVKDRTFYLVESVPKEANPQYGKREFWFAKGDKDDWSECVNVRINYFDTNNKLLKEQFIKWQKIKDAWVWEQVLVRNPNNQSASVFQVSGVSINTNLEDELFSERTLVRGPAAIPPLLRENAMPSVEADGAKGVQ